MAKTTIPAGYFAAGSIATADIAANAITSAKLAQNSVLTKHIDDNQVGIDQLNVSDGSDGQVLTTNGSGTLSFSTISGTTINNNADNRVITGSGTANTLEGESNFTFDGTTTVINNTGNADSTLLQLKNTPSTAGTYKTGLEFWSNEGTANNQTYNAGRIYSEFDGSNYSDSRLTLGSASGGGSFNDEINIKNGKVGIGVVPTHNFNQQAAGVVEARFRSTDNDCFLQISSDVDEGQDSVLQFLSGTTTRASIIYDHNTTAGSQSMIFKTGDNAVTAMSINGTGQILINGANESYPNDTATYGGAAANVIIKGPNSATTDNAMFIYGGRLCLNAHPDRYNMRSYIQSDGSGLKVWHIDNSDFVVGVNNTERFRVQYSDGRIKSQATYDNSAPATHRDVYVENSGQLGYASSVRAHKTNITDYGDASWLYSINPKTFNYRKKNMDIVTNDDGVEHEEFNGTYSDTEYYNTVEVGFIAEDVEEHDSNLCFYNQVEDDEGNITNELAGIHYKAMVAPMLKLIKEQKTLIDDLTARIETLENA